MFKILYYNIWLFVVNFIVIIIFGFKITLNDGIKVQL